MIEDSKRGDKGMIILLCDFEVFHNFLSSCLLGSGGPVFHFRTAATFYVRLL